MKKHTLSKEQEFHEMVCDRMNKNTEIASMLTTQFLYDSYANEKLFLEKILSIRTRIVELKLLEELLLKKFFKEKKEDM